MIEDKNLLLPFKEWEMWDRSELEFCIPGIIHHVLLGDSTMTETHMVIFNNIDVQDATMVGDYAAVKQYYDRMTESVGNYIAGMSKANLLPYLREYDIIEVTIPTDTLLVVKLGIR